MKPPAREVVHLLDGLAVGVPLTIVFNVVVQPHPEWWVSILVAFAGVRVGIMLSQASERGRG